VEHRQGNTFGKADRLKSRNAIDAVFRSGKTLHQPPFRVHFQLSGLPTNAPVQVAIAVPKRFIKRANQRNLVKRHVREAWRHHIHALRERLSTEGIQMAVVVVYTTSKTTEYQETEDKIILILNRLIQSVDQQTIQRKQQ
jgi:ribonuclease P protein component